MYEDHAAPSYISLNAMAHENSNITIKAEINCFLAVLLRIYNFNSKRMYSPTKPYLSRNLYSETCLSFVSRTLVNSSKRKCNCNVPFNQNKKSITSMINRKH